MSIKDPISYGDWYWKQSVDASKDFGEQAEKALAPFISGLLVDIELPDETPDGLRNLINEIANPKDFEWATAMIGVGVNAVDEALDLIFDPILKIMKRANNRRTLETWLTPSQVNTLWSRVKITEGLWDESITSEGYEPALGALLYESELPYPTIPDVILYSRYHADPKNIEPEFKKWWNIHARDLPIWKWLGMQRLTTDQVHTAWRRGFMVEDDVTKKYAQIGWDTGDNALLRETGWTIPNAMLLVQGNLQQEAETDTILADISLADINPKFAEKYLDAVLTKPASQDVLAYGLRQDASLSGIENQLRKIGIHPDYHKVYKELAYQIPPVADIITMAVREAFTPEIAKLFGQYEDLPDEFVEWVGKKGLTKEWASRYWAAHWSLPSPQQGFEMLHRGIIKEDELSKLMRALDIMPYWRDKLMQMSYRRLTRVDVRRMYRQGVLNETEVLEAYLQHGYNPENAKRMTEFTIKQSLSQMAKFTTADVVSAFTKQMISRSDAKNLLSMLGVRTADREYIISTAEYKRVWALTEQKIRGVRNLYRQRVYDENQTRDKLSRLDLPADRITALMEQWYYEIEAEDKKTWTTAQTLGFMEDKIITMDRGRRELRIIGYDEEHINAYIKAM